MISSLLEASSGWGRYGCFTEAMSGRLLIALMFLLLLGTTSAVSLAGGGRDGRILQRVRDANDVAGPLDLAAASVRVRAPRGGRPGVLLLRLSTHGEWASSVIPEKGIAPNYLGFEFDRGRAAARDRCLEVRARPGDGLTAQMKRPVCAIPFSRAIGQPVRVRRRGPRAIELTLPQRYLGRRPLSRRFRATSSFEAPGHPDCAAPAYPPPEQSFGSCRDLTRWARITRVRRAAVPLSGRHCAPARQATGLQFSAPSRGISRWGPGAVL